MIYLDNHSSTQIDKRVMGVMTNIMENHYGNPHTSDHSFGWNALDIVETARKNVADSVLAKPVSVIFTSGATESNNIFIQGIVPPEGRKTILVSTIEHSCIMQSLRIMEDKGYVVKYIPVDTNGRLDMDAYASLLDDSVALVSVIAVNNVIGVYQDIKTIGQMAQDVGALFHTDASQAVGKINIDMKNMPIDALTISGHKIYGPMGVGALVIKKGITVNPILFGGGQEKGIRAGTVPVPLVAGLGEACRIAAQEYESEDKRIKTLRNIFINKIMAGLSTDRVRVLSNNTISGSIPLYVSGVEKSDIFARLKHTCVSSGSACSSKGGKSSSVLQAIGMNPSQIGTLLRVCIGRSTTKEEIDVASDDIINAISPLL